MKHQKASLIVIHDQNVIINSYHSCGERDEFLYVKYIDDSYICNLGKRIKSLFRGAYSLKRDQNTAPNLIFTTF